MKETMKLKWKIFNGGASRETAWGCFRASMYRFSPGDWQWRVWNDNDENGTVDMGIGDDLNTARKSIYDAIQSVSREEK